MDEDRPHDLPPHPRGELPAASLERLEPAVVIHWRFQGLIRTGILLLMATLAAAPALAAGGGPFFLAGVGSLLAVVASLAIGWLPGARYRRFRFSVDERYLYVQYGLLVHREKVIPVSRMQHVDIQRGPIERLLGLASLSVYTAGGAGATFRLPGLAPERGEELRAQILAAKG